MGRKKLYDTCLKKKKKQLSKVKVAFSMKTINKLKAEKYNILKLAI